MTQLAYEVTYQNGKVEVVKTYAEAKEAAAAGASYKPVYISLGDKTYKC